MSARNVFAILFALGFHCISMQELLAQSVSSPVASADNVGYLSLKKRTAVVPGAVPFNASQQPVVPQVFTPPPLNSQPVPYQQAAPNQPPTPHQQTASLLQGGPFQQVSPLQAAQLPTLQQQSSPLLQANGSQDQIIPEVPPTNVAAEPAAADTPERKIDPSRHFGNEAPPILPPITYLRNEAVLLKCGQHMLDLGVVYAVNQYDFPVVVLPNSLTSANVVDRNVYVPFAYRYGITDSLQAQVFVPLGVSWEQLDVIPSSTQTATTGPIGDVIASLNYSLPQELTGNYNIVWNNQIAIPTGNAHDLFFVPDAQFGKGWYEYGTSVLAIRRYDPLLVFGGVGMRYAFQTEISGQDVQRGISIDYQYGVGFGVNETIALSCKLFGSYEPELRVNHQSVAGSQRDLVALRFALTKATEKKIMEPFVTIGCTQQANDVQLGVIWTFR